MHLITIISPLTGLLDTVEFSVNTIPFFLWLVQVKNMAVKMITKKYEQFIAGFYYRINCYNI